MASDLGVTLIPNPTANPGLVGDLVPSFFKLPNELSQLKNIQGQLLDIIVVCALLAVLVMIVVQFIKILIRRAFFRQVVRQWLQSLAPSETMNTHIEELFRDLKNRDLEGRRIENPFQYNAYVYTLSRSLFMKRVENSCRQILTYPRENPRVFAAITDGVAPRDALTYLKHDDEDAGKSNTRAFDRVNQAVDSNLDSLQLMLTQKWIFLVRGIALLVGISMSFGFIAIAGTVGRGELVFVVGIGILAGFMASIFYYLFSRLWRE